MKNGSTDPRSRRHFLRQLAALVATSAWWQACADAVQRISARFTGAPAALGHRLLTRDFPPVTREERVKILVIGGGIAGLSACRTLVKNGETAFLLLDLDEQPGGNSAWRQNAYTRYPLGAHYLPLPNTHDAALIEFLREENIITGFDAGGEPVFREEYLAAAPQARLYIREYWQEGLIPAHGVSEDSQAQLRDFYKKMEDFKRLRGADGKYVFDIPVNNASVDPAWRHLDGWTMQTWLQREGYSAPELFAHVDYCCLDDFGAGVARVSAWAGIHYFAARKSAQDTVLTWPEGNGFLVNCFEKYTRGRLRQQCLAYHLQPEQDSVFATVYDAAGDCSVRFTAEKVVLATPQFVNQRLLPARRIDLSAFHYAPWLVATLVLRELPDASGMPLCWDNVIYKGKGLGYINTLHQSVAQRNARQVITCYHAFDGPAAQALRRELYRRNTGYWQRYILDDLRQAHPGIESQVESMDIQRWGHGMISPVPGFLFGDALAAARQPLGRRIFFAHSDLSGMSLFEEAFHQGVAAAESVLAR